MKRATIYDISKIVKVNPSTVSRALKNDPSISIQTKERIREVAQSLNYHPNQVASQLKSGKRRIVGVIVPYINHGLFSAVIDSLESCLFPLGYHVIICQSHEDYRKEVQHVTNLLANQVAGIFISVSNSVTKYNHYEQIVQHGIPLIFFDRSVAVPGTSSVIVNDYQGSYMATQHLIEQGCSHIVHLQGSLQLQIYQDRLQGYIQALRDHQIPVRKNYVLPCHSNIEQGKKVVLSVVSKETTIDGICSSSDPAALGALQALTALKVKVPEQIAITGYSNELFTQLIETPLTSIEQMPRLMGREAAHIFLDYDRYASRIPVTIQKCLEPQLVIRTSSMRKNKMFNHRNL